MTPPLPSSAAPQRTIRTRLQRAFVPTAAAAAALPLLLTAWWVPAHAAALLAFAGLAGAAVALGASALSLRIGEELDRAQAHLLQVEARLRETNTGIEHRHERARDLERWAKGFGLPSWGVLWVEAGEGRVQFANAEAARMWGGSAAALLGLPVEVLVDPLQAPELRSELQGAQERGGARFELRVRRRDGTLFPAAFNVAVQGGNVLFLSVGDLTERKRAEERARRSLERGSAVIEAALDCIVGVDDHGRIIEFNPAAERTFGHRRAEVLGRLLAEVVLPQGADDAPEHPLVRHFLPGSPVGVRLETLARHQSGRLFPIELSVAELQGDDGPERVGFIRDITDRRQAEVELRKWALVFEQAGLGIAIYAFDDAGEVVVDVANRCFAQLHGYTVDELRRVPVRSLRHTDPDKPMQLAVDVEAIGQLGHLTFESTRLRKDGSTFPALMDVTAMRDAGGRVTGFVAGVQDISALRQAVDALHRAKEAAEAANRAKSEFLARMSHELRTPLNAIIGFGELLHEQAQEGSRAQAHLGHIVHAGHHLLGVINDLLDLAKVEAGRDELTLELTDPAETATEALGLIEPLAATKQLARRLHLPQAPTGAPPRLWLDRGKLRQVLYNLLSNAVKFTPRGGAVELTLALEPAAAGRPARCLFRVTDTGIGIAPADRALLFQPFVQLESALGREHKGTGLGLVMAAKLVALHGGAIGVESEPGKGSTFHFDLPEQPPGRARPPSGPNRAAEASGRSRILVVDDSAPNAALASEILTAGGYQVLIACDALQALTLAIREQPALVLMDLAMPGMDGLEATRRLRAEAATRHIPVVAWTAYAMAGQVDRALDAGCEACLTKPVSASRLLRQIERTLADGGAAKH